MQIKVEQVGDVPVIGHLLSETNLALRVDSVFGRHHLWQGPGVGQTLMGLLLYILSTGDHRMSHVESWASSLETSLGQILGYPGFKGFHLSDDRLGNLLDLFSKEGHWSSFLRSSNEELLRVYSLDLETPMDGCGLPVFRMDTTSAQSDRLANGLFQSGYNAHKSDLPQLKLAILSADRGNFPLTLGVFSGERADDGLYMGVLRQAWDHGLSHKGNLLVGDSKLCNEDNMGTIAQNGNYYLCPMPQKQFSHAELARCVEWIYEQQEQPEVLKRLAAQHAPGKEKEIAQLMELQARDLSVVLPDGQSIVHTQRLIACCPLARRQKELDSLERRMQQAKADIKERFIVKRGRKTLTTEQQGLETALSILKGHKVEHLFEVIILPQAPESKGVQATLAPIEKSIEQEKKRCGWRVFATNAPQDKLTAQNAVLLYWDEHLVEQQFHLLLDKCAALMPIYLHKQNRAVALCRILFLALQFSALFQHRLRTNLAKAQQPFLTDIVPGNPGAKVRRPTTQAVLARFKNLQLVFIEHPDGQLTCQIKNFKPVHNKILELLNVPLNIFLKPFFQRTEDGRT